MLVLVIDLAEKVEDFVGPNAPSWSKIFIDYYLNFIPFINSLIFPIYTLITVIFFTSRLAGNSEIIGMLGNGVSFYRIMVPYIIGGLVITGLHLLGNHFLFPTSSKIRVEFENTYIYRNNFNTPTENIHFMLDNNTEVYIHILNRADTSGRNVWLMEYDSSGIQRPKTLIAKGIKSLGGNKWQFRDYRIRTVDGMDEKIERGAVLDTTLNFTVPDVMRRKNYHQAMTTPELREYIAYEKRRGMADSTMYEVENYRRTADPFTNLILTMIGFAVASRKTRGGMGLHLVFGIGLGALFIFMTKFSTTFATNAGFSPFVAMWIPNFLFTFVAIGLLLKAQK